MEYRVTEKHPYLKKDLIITPLADSCDHGQMIYQLGQDQESLGFNIHQNWLVDGWLEEVQEPEFTENDMEKAFEAGGSFRMACKNLTDKVIDKTEWADTEDFVEFMKSNYED